MLTADAVMRPKQPLLEVAHRPVRTRHDVLRALPYVPLRLRDVGVARATEQPVSGEAVGVERAPCGDVPASEVEHRLAAEVRDDLHANPAGSLASALDRHDDQGGVPAPKLSAAPDTGLRSADPGLVHLDL